MMSKNNGLRSCTILPDGVYEFRVFIPVDYFARHFTSLKKFFNVFHHLFGSRSPILLA